VTLQEPKPLYKIVEDHVTARIRSGEWKPRQRIPSEKALGESVRVSRITVTRALNRLVDSGLLIRIPGVGTFVAEPRAHFGLVTIDNISDEIRSRGHVHSSRVKVLKEIVPPTDIVGLMELSPNQEVYHSVIVHSDNSVPVQIEERYVLPDIAPDYIKLPYGMLTTFEYLRGIAEVTEVEQTVRSIRPTPQICEDLKIPPDEACLFMRRRTWCGDSVTTISLLTHPGSRFEISGRFDIHLIPTGWPPRPR